MTDSDDVELHPLFRDYQDELAREEVRRSRKIVRKQIRDRILSHTAPPWPVQAGLRDDPQPQPRIRVPVALEPAAPTPPVDPEEDILNLQAELEERERYLRRGRSILENQQRAVQEQEMLLKMREKYLHEKADLIAAREKRIMEKGAGAQVASVSDLSGSGQVEGPRDISDQERESFNRLREELDRREKSLEAREDLLREREAFIEESETTLFEKAQELQEREEELAALADALQTRREKLDVREGIEVPKEKL